MYFHCRAIAIALLLSATLVCAKIIFEDSFTSLDYTKWDDSDDGKTAIKKIQPCTGGRTGTCVEFGITYCATGDPCYRSELSQKGNYKIGEEYWFGFSLQLPTYYTQDRLSNEEIHFQMHGVPRFDIGEPWRNPLFAISVKDMNWFAVSRGDPRENITGPPFHYKYDNEAPIGKAEPGKWVDFIYHTLYKFDGTGFVQIYKDNVLVFNQQNTGTCYNDEKGPYMKIGTYKWDWEEHKNYTSTSVVTDYWEVKVGDSTSSKDEVSTACTTQSCKTANVVQ